MQDQQTILILHNPMSNNVQIRLKYESTSTTSIFIKVIEIVDTLFNTFYITEMHGAFKKLIPCSHCLVHLPGN